tara:strand:+ start:177 stop:698 length:522 start_codon:yes stop_codon:yes gene_type:complete
MKLSIIPADKIIALNNQSLVGIKTDLSWIPTNVYAVQWNDNWEANCGLSSECTGISTGFIQYNDSTPPLGISTTGIYWQGVTAFENEKSTLENEREAARDHLAEVKRFRMSLLYDSDWTQSSDSPFNDSKKTEWATYRQQLRDLPATIAADSNITAKAMMDDINHSAWPTKPS